MTCPTQMYFQRYKAHISRLHGVHVNNNDYLVSPKKLCRGYKETGVSLTFARRLHATGRVNRVTKETVARHRQSYDA